MARIATRQHGVVARAQLIAAGITRSEIEERLRSGALIAVHRGVYRVGHRAPSIEAAYFAAVLAGGEGALLGGEAASRLFELTRTAPSVPVVITPRQRRIDGVVTRRTRSFDARDATKWRGIPVTTVPRTLVDLAACMSEDDLAQACHTAQVLHRVTPARVEAVLARRPTAPGARTLRRILHGDVHVTLSHLERLFLELLREARLPLPHTNRAVDGRYVDCRWPHHRLTVELDSYRYHSSRLAWERDRRREREARARGDDFRRLTYEDVTARPAAVADELASVLPRTGPACTGQDALRGPRRSSPARR